MDSARDGGGGDRVYAYSTLAELLVTQATQWVVDKVIDDFNEKYKNAKKFGEDIRVQAAGAAAISAVTSHLRPLIAAQDVGEVVSGASLSFRLFESPYSFIEGEFDLQDPELNYVYVIGPKILEDLAPLIDNTKKTYSAAKDVKKDLKALVEAVQSLVTSANDDVAKAAANARQEPTGVDRPCVFSPGPECVQLLYDDGFRSVYEYSPPPGFESFTGLPLPTIFLVYNARRDTFFLAIPPFFPTPKPKPPAPTP